MTPQAFGTALAKQAAATARLGPDTGSLPQQFPTGQMTRPPKVVPTVYKNPSRAGLTPDMRKFLYGPSPNPHAPPVSPLQQLLSYGNLQPTLAESQWSPAVRPPTPDPAMQASDYTPGRAKGIPVRPQGNSPLMTKRPPAAMPKVTRPR